MSIIYRPVRKAARKGAHERTTGHEWRCTDCNAIVHEEPLAGLDENEKQAEKRRLRTERAIERHKCAKAKANA